MINLSFHFSKSQYPKEFVQISAYHPRQLSWRIDQAFQDLYIRNHITATDILEKRELFVKKQINLIKIFEKLLWDQVLTDPNIPTEKRFSMLYKFINEIRADLLAVEAKGGLLEQFYNFLDSKKVSGYVTMRNGDKLYLDLSNFQGEDIMRWQGLSSDNFRSAFGDFKRYQFINPMSKDFVESISNLILDVGGEVEVFPLWYANDKLDPNQSNYKYIYYFQYKDKQVSFHSNRLYPYCLEFKEQWIGYRNERFPFKLHEIKILQK